MPIPDHLRGEILGEEPAKVEHKNPDNATVLKVGDTVKAHDRDNFGRVVAIQDGGWYRVKFKNPQTGATKTIAFRASDLTLIEGASLPETPRNIEPPPMPEVITAKALQSMKFQDPVWIIPGIIPEGTTLICGKPKVGKSFLSLNVGLALACGGYALGKTQVARHGVLYLSLEDLHRRLQQRISDTFGPSAWPEEFFMATQWPSMADGCIECLRRFKEEHPSLKLIIIDVLQRIRGRNGTTKDVYAADYEIVGNLKTFADANGLSLIIVHHLRKSPGDGDILDEVSGSTGLTGAVDTVLVLKKDKGKGLLYLRGRDVEEAELRLDRVQGGGWVLMGDAEECRNSEAQQAIIDLIKSSPDKPLCAKDIEKATGRDRSNVYRSLKGLIEKDLIFQSGKFYFLRQQPTATTTMTTATTDDNRNPVSVVVAPQFQSDNGKKLTGKDSAGIVVGVVTIRVKCADCGTYVFNEKPNLPGQCAGEPWDDSRRQFPQLPHECEHFFAKGIG